MKRDIIKTESFGKKLKYPRGQKSLYREEGDFGPRRISIKKSHVKDFYGPESDVKYGPIARFLHKHKGKKWDEVYSEICEQADSRTWDGKNFRETIEMVVEKNCFIEGDKVFDEHGFELGRWSRRFYIHPETNTLEEAIPSKKRRKKDCPQTVFKLDDTYYHKHEGAWYRVEMKEITKDTIKQLALRGWVYRHPADYHDVFLAGKFGTGMWSIDRKLQEEYGFSENGNIWYCVKKQSANRKEIAKLKSLCDV